MNHVFNFWILPGIVGLFLGSFLNVIAYRLGVLAAILPKRSHCPTCNTELKMIDLVPVFSWLWLKGRCRYCQNKISFLYPLIEVLTAITTIALTQKLNYIQNQGWHQDLTMLSYIIFFYSLIICVRTDLESMVVLRLFTIWLVPVGLLTAYFNFLDISFYESLIGAVVGYASLFIIAKGFKFFTKKDGLGDGDMEMLSMIGAFIGPLGVWMTLMIGSIVGSLFGITYLVITKKGKNTRIPFGPFLALGAAAFFFLKDWLVLFLIN